MLDIAPAPEATAALPALAQQEVAADVSATGRCGSTCQVLLQVLLPRENGSGYKGNGFK